MESVTQLIITQLFAMLIVMHHRKIKNKTGMQAAHYESKLLRSWQ
jgi:hypothetical protein